MSRWKQEYDEWRGEERLDYIFQSAFFNGAMAALRIVNASNKHFDELYDWRFTRERTNDGTEKQSTSGPLGAGKRESDPGSPSCDGDSEEVSPR